LPSSSLMGAPTSPFSVCTHDFPEKFWTAVIAYASTPSVSRQCPLMLSSEEAGEGFVVILKLKVKRTDHLSWKPWLLFWNTGVSRLGLWGWLSHLPHLWLTLDGLRGSWAVVLTLGRAPSSSPTFTHMG
jgi:hypothetical protein